MENGTKKNTPQKKHARGIWDYRDPGIYFVTICTHNKESLFDTILNGEMRVNEIGQMVLIFWNKLEEKYESVVNYSFNSTIEKDEIIFDYKIHNGICKGFNASKLMEKMGIVLHINKN